jgi:hypothetical protein
MSLLNRRDVLGMLGAGAAGLVCGGVTGFARPALGTALATAADGTPNCRPSRRSQPESSKSRGRTSGAPWELVAPLAPGSRLGNACLVRLTGAEMGAVNAEFEDADSAHFVVRICRRDSLPGAPTAVAQTELYELYLANGGKGNKLTDESHGLVVMALAAVIRNNEIDQPVLTVGTIRERWRLLGAAAG